MPNKIDNLLRLAKKAGKLKIGRSPVLGAIKKGRVQLIIVADDASIKIEREIKFENKKIEVLKYSTKNKLGELFGRQEVAVLAICDKNFAHSISQLLLNENE